MNNIEKKTDASPSTNPETLKRILRDDRYAIITPYMMDEPVTLKDGRRAVVASTLPLGGELLLMIVSGYRYEYISLDDIATRDTW